MNDYWRMVLPFTPLLYQSCQYAINFILFYQDEADQEATQQKPTTAYYAVASSLYKALRIHYLITPAYVFLLLYFGYIVTNALFSAGLAMGLMLGEYRFNHDIIQATQPASPTHRLLNSSSLADRCQYFVTGLYLNGFANTGLLSVI